MNEAELTLVFEPVEADLERCLEACQRAIQAHPIAAQAIFGALVAEGRCFAATEEGGVWQARLVDSELLDRARLVWETLSLTALSADAQEPLPSACIDAVARAASVAGLEPLLSKLTLESLR